MCVLLSFLSSYEKILVNMRGLILEASKSPRKISVFYNSTSSIIEMAPANAQLTPEMSRQCSVFSGVLTFSVVLKQSSCSKVMSEIVNPRIVNGVEEIGTSNDLISISSSLNNSCETDSFLAYTKFQNLSPQ